MKLNSRDRLTLGVFIPIVAGSCAIIVNALCANPRLVGVYLNETKSSPASSAAASNKPRKDAWVVARPASDYGVVTNRKLFGSDGPATEQPVPFSDPAGDIIERPVQQTTVSALIHNPEADRVTVVGRVEMDGTTFAVVENFGVGESRYVPVGGEAFGYRIVRLEGHDVLLEREGQQFSIQLGAYKPEPRRGRGSSSSTQVQTPYGTFTMGQLDQWRAEARKSVVVTTPYGALSSDAIHDYRNQANRAGWVQTPNGVVTRDQLDQYHEQSHQNERRATVNTPIGTLNIEQIDAWRQQGGGRAYSSRN